MVGAVTHTRIGFTLAVAGCVALGFIVGGAELLLSRAGERLHLWYLRRGIR
jgi:hypothetical protein